MKKIIITLAFLSFYKAFLMVFLMSSIIAFSQESKTHDVTYWQTTEKMKNRAEKGEKVLMIIVKIKNLSNIN